jgi:hypothetical protein
LRHEGAGVTEVTPVFAALFYFTGGNFLPAAKP